MAFNQNLAPFRWRPSSANVMGANSSVPGTPLPGGQVRAGDWCQVLLSYPSGTTDPVAYAAARFLVHIIYTPDSDDATAHEDQMVTYGGSASNRRRNYHIDPGVTFQAPFNGQLSIIAGDESRANVVLDVLLNRGFRPRDKQREIVEQQAEVEQQIIDMADVINFGMPLREPNGVETRSLGPTGLYPPPVVGTPQLVPSTWVDIPMNTALPFPDGAVQMRAVFVAAPAVAPFALSVVTLGNTFTLDLAPGLVFDVSAYGQGGACVGGVPATWAPNVNLRSMTVFTSLGG